MMHMSNSYSRRACRIWLAAFRRRELSRSLALTLTGSHPSWLVAIFWAKAVKFA